MPKKPILTPAVLPQRPKPPRGLPAASRALWGDVVRDFPPAHFRGANLALLETFCRAWALVHQCDALLADGILLDGKAHPALAIRTGAWGEMRHCATKLRLSISSTMRSEAAAAKGNAKHAMRKPWE